MTSAIALRASKHSASFLWRQSSGSSIYYAHIKGAISCRADGRAGPDIEQLVAILGVRISPRPTPKRLRLVSADVREVTDVTAIAFSGDSVRAFWPGKRPLCWRTIAKLVYKSMYLLGGILIHRQNVVLVGAGRTSRSAKFVTSSELLYAVQYADRVLWRI